MSGPSLFRVPGKLPITFRAARSRSTGLSRMWRAGPSVIFSTASEKSGGPLCGPCGPRGGPLRSRVVAEEAEFAYKDFARGGGHAHRIDISRRVGSFTPIGNIKA